VTGRTVLPLEGVNVLDLTRMLPGAVLARTLIDLGASLTKIEDPALGDPFRHVPPLVEGIGAGFAVCYRGARSAALDLAARDGASALLRLARHADVLLESFRPGTLQAWGLGPERLAAANPALIVCSLSSFGAHDRVRTAHDLNLTSVTGFLSELSAAGVPRVQVADIGTALLAASAVLAALLRRARTGTGMLLDQPLAAGPLPFLLWAWADSAAGGESLTTTVLAGRCPSYRLYRCADGLELALAALEPKLWVGVIERLGLAHLAGAGLDTGAQGRAAALELETAFGSRPRAAWLAELGAAGLPVSAVNDLSAAREEGDLAWLLERTPIPGGGALEVPGPFLPTLGRTPAGAAPLLGEHTAAVLSAAGLEPS
jgi:crotonobetainyl-CoA:carnitine CoA-transferase CaiB-like acyl-CoA transferase